MTERGGESDSIDRGVAAGIRLVTLDVDGVLTDGGIVMTAGGSGGAGEARRFHAHDGVGLHLLEDDGITVALVSGRSSDVVRARATDLGISEVHLGWPFGKVAAVQGVVDRLGVDWSAIAHVGDDLTDLALFARVGLSAAPANAVPEVKQVADWVGAVAGGAGAVREFARALLLARGSWGAISTAYVARGHQDE